MVGAQPTPSKPPPPPSTEPIARAPDTKKRRKLFFLLVLAGFVLLAGGWAAWTFFTAVPTVVGIVSANGRIEANQVDIATKVAGQILDVVPHEGDMIEAGSIVARLDPAEIQAQLRQSQAEAQLSRYAVTSTEAAVANRMSELTFAEQELRRTAALAKDGYAPRERLDQRQQQVAGAQSALNASKAQVDQALSAIAAADAHVDQLKTLLGDATIRSPARGRIQYRLIEPGAVLPAGGRIVTLLDLSDVYMTIFLPSGQAGKLAIGDEARVVLDAFPQYVFPATISFVATEAQFTPKTVETSSEREKLMFRIKLQAPREMLVVIEDRVKTGLRGLGYVRVDSTAQWPDRLSVNLPK